MNNREHKKNENFVTQELKKENANDKKNVVTRFRALFYVYQSSSRWTRSGL